MTLRIEIRLKSGGMFRAEVRDNSGELVSILESNRKQAVIAGLVTELEEYMEILKSTTQQLPDL